MECKSVEPALGCWARADGTFDTVVIHYTYGADAGGGEIISAVRYTLADGTPIALADGEEVTPGACAVADCERGVPLGICKCYGSGSGDASYTNPDNTTDGQFSIGGTGVTLMKWAVFDPEPAAQGLADFTAAVVACIESGNVASLTLTDPDGNTYLFDADAVASAGNPDGSGGWLFSGPGAPASGSGKLTSATLTCGGSAQGTACAVSVCDDAGDREVLWIDSETGAELTPQQVETLTDCPAPDTCDLSTSQSVVCAAEAATTDDGTPITAGDQLLAITQVDCLSVVVASQTYHLSSQEPVSEAVLTEQCDPAPDTETTRDCFVDSSGVQWTQVNIIDPADPANPLTLFYDATFTLGTPAGTPADWSPCEPPARVVRGRISRLTSGDPPLGFIGGVHPDNAVRSVTVTVLAGTAAVTDAATNTVDVPAGVSLTWSATGDDEGTNGLLRSVSAGSADADVIVHWTEEV